MNIIFFGTPDYVIPVLDSLHKTFRTKSGTSPIMAVVTQRPKPTGRDQRLEYSAVDNWAHKKKIPIHFNPRDVKAYEKAELGILASYGQIIPGDVIDHFEYGILNVHPSLLPYWRGASPVQASIIDGGSVGSTIMKLDEKLDHGSIVDQFEDELKEDDNTETLRSRLFERSAEVLGNLIPAYINKKINLEEQIHEKATFTSQINKDHAYINPHALRDILDSHPEFISGSTTNKKLLKQVQNDNTLKWEIPFMKDYATQYKPLTIYNFIRAMQPWPQAWTTVKLDKNAKETKRLKLLKSHLGKNNGKTENDSQKTGLGQRITENDEWLILDEVQLEGKTPVTWKQFTDGYPEFKFSK